MGKFVSGFLLGAMLTGGLFAWLGDSAAPPTVSASYTPAGRPANPQAELSESTGPGATAANDPAARPAPADGEPGTRPMPDSGLVEREILPDTSSAQTAHTGRPPPQAVEPEPQSDYPPEIQNIVENHLEPELRQRYENDPREESWATYMEGQLQAYFASKPELQLFNFTLVDCRTTVCAVHALGYGPQALTQWNIATADIVMQPWHDFGSMSVNRQNPQPDILGIVLVLTRKPQ